MSRRLRLLSALRPMRLAAPLGAAAGFATSSTCPYPVRAATGEQEDAKAKAAERAFWVTGASSGEGKAMASKFDVFGGVIIDPKAVPRDQAAFRQLMQSSLSEWSALSKKGVWLQIGVGDSELIPIATAEFGFEFHHAERDHVMLTKWLPKDIPNTLPQNASHTVGVGAIVTDPVGRVLLVKEKSGPAARLDIWKLPTGLVDAGEELPDAALREVREETGVEARFDFLGSFVMNHGGNPAHPNKSNLFFIVKCSAVSTDISAQESEIAEARWFTREEWSKMPFPEKGTVWEVLNSSALEYGARIETKKLGLGSTRPGHRICYIPVPKPSL